MRAVQIIDLDGCISDDTRRLPLIDTTERGWKAWRAYHEDLERDALRNAQHIMGGVRIAIITARPTYCADATNRWLARNGIRYHAMIMRNTFDYRPSVEVKREAIGWLTQMPEYDVRLSEIIDAIDDRDDVVAMYRELGLPARVVKIGA